MNPMTNTKKRKRPSTPPNDNGKDLLPRRLNELKDAFEVLQSYNSNPNSIPSSKLDDIPGLIHQVLLERGDSEKDLNAYTSSSSMMELVVSIVLEFIQRFLKETKSNDEDDDDDEYKDRAMQWAVTCLHQVLKVDTNLHIDILDTLVAANDNEEGHPGLLLKHEQWVQDFLLSVLEEQESAGMRRRTCTAGGGGGMDFKLLDWKQRCQRVRNQLSGSGERDDGDEEIERYLHRPEAWCAALKNKDTGQAVVPPPPSSEFKFLSHMKQFFNRHDNDVNLGELIRKEVT
jgi:hypothetical protein